ncbi:uncharacterized protein [Dermacentor andersoni]|uniref:uncharacterized protein n=1 Tax=Dermacentor andersoni TaxID=34620 RepID=UPI003B3BB0E8
MHLGGNCPARGKNCRKCGAQNHFAQVCKSVGATHNASRPGKELREVRAETDDFFLAGLAINSLEVDKWTATVYIEGQPVTCKLDTGANCCVISKNELERLPAKPKEACKVTLTAFFGHRTTAQAKVKLLLYANNKKCEEQFFVVEHDVPVTLSGAVAERLGFIYRIQKVSSEELYRPAQPFADVFSGLGQLKGVEYSMKLKPGSAGTVVPARRVPIALQDKVLAELQRMEQQGVITKAEVRYLGHILTTQGLRIDPERVQDILEIPEPKTKTAWPEHKHGVPEPGRPYWTYREEVHAQDGLVFRSNKRLMGRQTRTLLPVPTIHLEPEAIPSKEVHDRLQTIRRRQKIHYDRSARNISPLTPGQRVTTYDTLQRTWAPAIVLRPAATPRSTIVKTEDGHEIRRTREHLREAAPQPEPESTSQGPSEDDLQSGQQQLRRSTRLRREPCRYPLPDETSRPYHH